MCPEQGMVIESGCEPLDHLCDVFQAQQVTDHVGPTGPVAVPPLCQLRLLHPKVRCPVGQGRRVTPSTCYSLEQWPQACALNIMKSCPSHSAAIPLRKMVPKMKAVWHTGHQHLLKHLMAVITRVLYTFDRQTLHRFHALRLLVFTKWAMRRSRRAKTIKIHAQPTLLTKVVGRCRFSSTHLCPMVCL